MISSVSSALQASYMVKESGTLVRGARHFGRNWTADLIEEIIDFEDNEYIEEIFGHSSVECINQFALKTSLGKTHTFGADNIFEESSTEFNIIAKSDQHFSTLRCTVGQYLITLDFEELSKATEQHSRKSKTSASKNEKNTSNSPANQRNSVIYSPNFCRNSAKRYYNLL